jgi:NAD-dependent DNA ligase
MPDRIYVLKSSQGEDDDGQPMNRRFNTKRLAERTTDELLGVCKGMIFDGVITADEVNALISWLGEHRHIANVWPVDALFTRIARMLEDQVIDEDERKELFTLLTDITGLGSVENIVCRGSTTLPLTKPAPAITFDSQTFCFTGKFYYGTRKRCMQVITEQGGKAEADVTLRTNYLVIGTIGSTDWIHSTHGRKIEHAVELNKKGHPVMLVSEEHWAKHL